MPEMNCSAQDDATIYCVDTCVLLDNPDLLRDFADSIIVIPHVVLMELDKAKSATGKKGFQAREALRGIETLAHMGENLWDGGVQNPFGFGRIYIRGHKSQHIYQTTMPIDYVIIDTAKEIQVSGEQVVLVSNDRVMRLNAQYYDIQTMSYRAQEVDFELGKIDHLVLYDDQYDELNMRPSTGIDLDCVPDDKRVNGQTFKVSNTSCSKNVLAKIKNNKLMQVVPPKSICGITPRNVEQKFVLDAIMDDGNDLIVINGASGSGKTLLSLAGGMALIERSVYDRLTIIKSIIQKENLGALPGDLNEKLSPWLAPYYDNLELLFRSNGTARTQHMIDSGKIEMEAVNFLRGRSLMGRVTIVDEVQNIHPSDMKTIVSRIGNTSKLILLGDVSQIDHPKLTEQYNGLRYTMECMAGVDNVSVFNLQKTERSKLAKAAIERL